MNLQNWCSMTCSITLVVSEEGFPWIGGMSREEPLTLVGREEGPYYTGGSGKNASCIGGQIAEKLTGVSDNLSKRQKLLIDQGTPSNL